MKNRRNDTYEDDTTLSLASLKLKAKALSILGVDRMSVDELIYEIRKAEGSDGAFGV